MLRRTAARRRAFTLLELILALTIGMILLIGLYLALDVFLNATNAGRQQIEQATLARQVLKTITNDINNNLPLVPVPPNATSTSTKTTNANAAAATTTPPTPYAFNLGVQGTSDRLTLYISKVPMAAKSAVDAEGNPLNGDRPLDSDLRRISYWLAGGNDTPEGLARQEVVMVTNDDEINSMPPDVSDPVIFAPHVIWLQFEYFDGTAWQPEWDGTALGPDGLTKVGPPMSIRITMKIGRTDGQPVTGLDDPNVQTFQHVVQIPTAVLPPPATSATTGNPPTP